VIFPITAYGNPILKKEAQEIDESYEDLDAIIASMFETMYAANGVGLAAPQINKSIRLFVVDAAPFTEVKKGEKPDPKAAGLETFKRVFINPVIESEEGDEWPFEEGCLSIPLIREEVMRKEKVVLSYFDETWKLHEEEFKGYAARIIQHEYDHLEGILFTDHLNLLKRRMIKKKLLNISKGEVDVSYKMQFPSKKR